MKHENVIFFFINRAVGIQKSYVLLQFFALFKTETEFLQNVYFAVGELCRVLKTGDAAAI